MTEIVLPTFKWPGSGEEASTETVQSIVQNETLLVQQITLLYFLLRQPSVGEVSIPRLFSHVESQAVKSNSKSASERQCRL